VLEPQPHLDGVHTVFGQIIDGYDIMDLIEQGDLMENVTVVED